MSTPQPPSAEQLDAARLALWRQNPGDAAEPTVAPILTVEAARHFVSTFGLVLFSPRSQHINSPAPSLVEATLAVANPAPTIAASATARTLLARLIAEGSAVSLNLLGAPTSTPDAPDFIASAATCPYIFTLRGDKAWKQPPATSGATKVTPLALNTYTLLVENGPASATDLATALGKEITEAAVLRALSELWQHLRVLPVPHLDGGPTLWETVAHRFTKQLKAGANAGQPSALSALISLYLSQALVATESDIETFLSPLAPRSRVRDVLHALTGARQLESVAIDGKTHLHLHGDLPNFASADAPVDGQAHSAELEDASAAAIDLAEDGSRIKKFIPKPRKVGTGHIERAKPFGSSTRPPREGRPFDRTSSDRPRPVRSGPPRDRAARPFSKPAGRFAAKPSDRPARPAFNKPWDEEKQARIDREAAQGSAATNPPSTNPGEPAFQDIDLDAGTASAPRPAFSDRAPKRPFADRARSGPDRSGPIRPAFPRKPGFGGDRPAFSRKPPFSSDRPSFTRKPPFNPDATTADARPPRRDFAPREGADARPPRRDFNLGGKPSFGDRKPFGKPVFGARRFDGSPNTGPDRPSAGGRPPFADRERRPFRRDESSGDARPPRREFTPRTDGGARPPREGFSKPRTFRDREGAEAGASTRPDRPAFRKFDAPRKPFAPREGGGDARPPRREGAAPGKPAFGGPKKPFTRSGPGAAGPREGGFSGSRDGSSSAAKKPFGAKPGGFAGKKSFSGKPPSPRGADAPGASTFDKFKGGNKPWGKRPPARKPRPDTRGEA